MNWGGEMHSLYADYSKKGQVKIQQMAFVLVAIMIFFGLVSLFYFSIRIANLEQSAVSLKEEDAKELVRKMSSSPEFIFSANDCSNCIDLDKVLILGERRAYENFWKLDYLEIEKVVSKTDKQCNRGNYPDCKFIKVVNETNDYGSVVSAFVSLCYWESNKGGYVKCELGRIHVSGEGIK